MIRLNRKVDVMAALLLTILSWQGTQAQMTLTTNVATDPQRAQFVYTDVENFMSAIRVLSDNHDTTAVLDSSYFEQGTPGLKIFVEKYELSPERLQSAMRKYPDAYSNLDQLLAALKAQESRFRVTYAKIRQEFDEAVFPPTYFLIGAHRGIGSGSVEGPLISIEKKTKESIASHLAATLVHEMTHMQQLAIVKEAYFEIFSGEKRTLLALSIREGVATYLAERIEGGSTHKNAARKYLLAHEEEIWRRFKQEMLGSETGEWLWSKPDNPEQPQDVGYALGARIAETFYERADDKQKAVREMLGVVDYGAFLKLSGYGEQWK